MRTAADYLSQLRGLLPRGVAWSAADGQNITDLMQAMADELARVDSRAAQLHEEADPLTTTELLSDWERLAGLPDNCSQSLAETQQQRRAALVSKLTQKGGQSPQYFIDLAADLGYTVTITEYRPFRVGINAVGDNLYGEDWIFTWSVNAPAVAPLVYFRVGQSTVGEPLVTITPNTELECAIRRAAPAHTNLLFAYS
jgi:uncharacterized protein YmfQ (DUF2313 family)